jgi:hypothetical protein
VVSFVLFGGLPASAGAALLVAIHGAYIAQARRPGPPAGALVGAAYVAAQLAAKLKS